eukprot:5301724-Heterocapsa_arctica.AAC.1
METLLSDLEWLFTRGGRQLRDPIGEPVEWHRRCYNKAADRLAAWPMAGGPVRHLAAGWRRLLKGNLRLLSDGSYRKSDRM